MAGLSDIRIVEGEMSAQGLRFAIVVSRFNAFVTERLLEGAVDTLRRTGAGADQIVVYRTPGAFELPMVARKILDVSKVDALIALGCLIRGDTIHFDLIASEASKGLVHASRETGVPVTFGLLTTDTLDQAINRAGAKHGNKGSEAALAAIEQARLYRAIEAAPQGK
jgi:6,7-dimethyl-8-ribityllumazine synthase